MFLVGETELNIQVCLVSGASVVSGVCLVSAACLVCVCGEW